MIGDAVIASANTIAALIISASDDPNGVFRFGQNSLSVTAMEDTTVTLE